MKTAAHSTYTGPGRVSISLGAPRGAPAGYRIYRTLAPTREMLKRGYRQEEFRREILDKLDPQTEWDKLHELAGGAEPVIQCFERPPFTATNWCHRRIVAAWFKETLGHDVDEIEPETAAQKRANDEARRAPASGPAGVVKRSMAFVRPAVDAIRAEIDRWWGPVLERLGVTRNWSWMGMPDYVREQLEPEEIDRWTELQGRYRAVDA